MSISFQPAHTAQVQFSGRRAEMAKLSVIPLLTLGSAATACGLVYASGEADDRSREALFAQADATAAGDRLELGNNALKADEAAIRNLILAEHVEYGKHPTVDFKIVETALADAKHPELVELRETAKQLGRDFDAYQDGKVPDNKQLREETALFIATLEATLEEIAETHSGLVTQDEISDFIEKLKTGVYDATDDTSNDWMENTGLLLVIPFIGGIVPSLYCAMQADNLPPKTRRRR